ncbi:MAG TPA: asparagine synthase (glutamine-hydrolyzing) [Blastocatellia bacterium]
MCGIAGIIATPTFSVGHRSFEGAQVETSDELSRIADGMLVCLAHRGPDDRGLAFETKDRTRVALGHTRLSIIDLSDAGHQPMWSPDRRYSITYNGEIYNFRDIRDELSGQGEGWDSHSDTEVLLRAFQHRGPECLPRLRGMFAFGVWDSVEEQLTLARDPFGIKPLYYYAGEDSFLFASEVRALLGSGLIPRKLSSDGLASYLRFGSVQSPLTMIEGVRSLSPGHYLTVKRGGSGFELHERSYCAEIFDRDHIGKVSSRQEAVEILGSKLEESIRHHLVSDVPVAAFLSGGIDSTVIVGLMSKIARERPRTFTVVFSESDYSEQSYAHLVSRRFGTEHLDVPVSDQQLLAALPDAIGAMDQPTMDGINTYVVSKAVRDTGIKVALSGLGSDELFAGYPSFRRAKRLRNLAAIPSRVRAVAAQAGHAVLGNSVQQRKAWDLLEGGGTARSVYVISRTLFGNGELPALLGPAHDALRTAFVPPELLHESDYVNAVSSHEIQGYMANTLLRDTDQMSMAHSLEARVPFVDVDLVSFVLSLPGKWKLDDARPKPLLLDATGDLVPEEVWHRKKMGFTLPFERWMRSALKAELDATFSDSDKLAGMGLTGFASGLWKRFNEDPRSERWARPWSLHVLKEWCQRNQVEL